MGIRVVIRDHNGNVISTLSKPVGFELAIKVEVLP